MTNKKVKIYTTPTCGWCKKTKEFLNEHKVKFEEADVSEDQEAAKEMIEKSGQMGVPTTIVEGFRKPIVGFNEEEFKEALGL